MKIIKHDPPLRKAIFLDRKWWQFWKPKQEVHEYGTEIDCEGKSLKEISEEISKRYGKMK